MSHSTDSTSWIVSATHRLLRWRWAVIALAVVAFTFFAAGIPRLTFAGDYRIFFSDDNPLIAAFDELQNTYSKNENLLLVMAPSERQVFTRENLAALEELTERAWQIPHSTRVDSLVNFQHTRAEGDELIVENLVEGAGEMSGGEIERVRGIALAEPRLHGRLVSEEGHVAAVNVLVQFEHDTPEKLEATVGAARELAAEFERRFPGLEVRLTGAVMLHNAFMEATQHDMATLVPLMYLGVVIFMLFFLRSVSGTVATVLVIAFSTAAAMGTAGWLGLALTPVSAVAPTLIMTLAVADSIHVLMAMLDLIRRGFSKTEAIVESLRVNFQPVMLTSVTTAVGFLSMNTSDAPPIRDLGNITAIGVLAAFLASVTVLPALAAVLPFKVRHQKASAWNMGRLADFVIARRRPILWVSVLVVLVLGALVPLNQLDEHTLEYFDESVHFRQDTDFVMENLTGVLQVEYSLAAGASGAIAEPEYLETLDAFAGWWREQPEVVHVDTISDVMKRLNRSMHGDDDAWYRLPESRELAAQYLLLYELSLPYGLDLNNQIDIGKSATRFTVTLRDVSSQELIALAERGETWLEERAPEAMSINGVGPSMMFAHISERNTRSMILGTVIALVVISLLLVFALRSLKFGLLSLVPNLVPALMGFGLWAILVGYVGFLLSIVLAMTLGIVVDDSVHFLSKYLRARREQKLESEDAVRYAFSSVGKALVATSAILVGGFAILSFSSFAQNSDMGQLTAMIIVLALVADAFLLPVLLLRIDRRAVPAESEARGAAIGTERQAA